MRKIHIHLLLLFLFTLAASSLTGQGYTIKGDVAGFPNQQVLLMDFYGDQNNIIDSTYTDMNGSFTFTFPATKSTGLYRIILGREEFFDVVFNKENIKLKTTAHDAAGNVQIIESIENLLYYDYSYNKNMSQYKLDLLRPPLDYYPKNDPFYEDIKGQYLKIRDEWELYVNNLIENNTNTITAKMARMEQEPRPDISLSPFQQKIFLRKEYLKHVDFTDTSLLRCNVIPTKLIGYLGLYQNSSISKEMLEQEFITAVDSILKYTRTNSTVYQFVVDYLIEGFDAYGFNSVITHLAENSLVEEYCEKDDLSSDLQSRIELLKKLAVGNPAPLFTSTDMYGKEVVLEEISQDYTLLVFWASWCPHCTNILPEIKDIYTNENQGNLQVIAVSLDTTEADYKEFIIGGDYNWINICDYTGWDTPVALDYGIYATPTMFLLNREKKIIGKPANPAELRSLVAK